MMDSQPIIKELLHLSVSRLPNLMSETPPLWIVITFEELADVLEFGSILQSHCSLDRFLPCMNEYHDLMSLFN